MRRGFASDHKSENEEMTELNSDEKCPDVQTLSASSQNDSTHPVRMEATLTAGSELGEIERHKLADSRHDVLKDYLAGKISAVVAMEILSVKKSRFYKLLKYMRGAKSYRALLSDRRGRKPGLTVTDPETLKLIEEMFEEHYPSCKTVAGVWKQCQTQADSRYGGVLVALDDVDHPLPVKAEEGCTLIEIIGENFSAKSKPPKSITISLKHDPKRLAKFHKHFGMGGIDGFNKSSKPRKLLTLNPDELLADAAFRKWLATEIDWRGSGLPGVSGWYWVLVLGG